MNSVPEFDYSYIPAPSQQPEAKPRYLVDYSPRDATWDVHRHQTDGVGVYLRHGARARQGSDERALLLKHAQRMDECAQALGFHQSFDEETGEIAIRLDDARFCRVRYCPICQWRRSLMWRARFYKSLPGLQAQFPKHRFLFLTLTVRNCPIQELRATLSEMGRAWQRLIKRPEFKIVVGWLRTIEVTRSISPVGDSHPHFHILLMVPPSYFGKSYISQARWIELWQSCARLDYAPSVRIKAVRPKGAKGKVAGLDVEDMQNAVMETLKYSTKPEDMVKDPAWLAEYAVQTWKLRFIASGGALKDVLKEHEESNQDLITPEGQEQEEIETDEKSALLFDWEKKDRKYRKRR